MHWVNDKVKYKTTMEMAGCVIIGLSGVTGVVSYVLVDCTFFFLWFKFSFQSIKTREWYLHPYCTFKATSKTITDVVFMNLLIK